PLAFGRHLLRLAAPAQLAGQGDPEQADHAQQGKYRDGDLDRSLAPRRENGIPSDTDRQNERQIADLAIGVEPLDAVEPRGGGEGADLGLRIMAKKREIAKLVADQAVVVRGAIN